MLSHRYRCNGCAVDALWAMDRKNNGWIYEHFNAAAVVCQCDEF